jgi:hypothetical protein
MYRISYRLMAPLAALIVAFTLQTRSAAIQQPNQKTGRTDTKSMTPEEPSLNLHSTSSAIKQARQVVIRDAKSLAALWTEHMKGRETPPPMPTVDFKKQDVIAVFAGSKTTGGYSVEIGDPARTAKKAVVPVTLYKPGPGTMVTQAFTAPCSFRAVPKLPSSVTFQVVEKPR